MDSDQTFRIRESSLGEFLRLRRSRLKPADVGLAGGRRRRTPGLRREEVADLAGIGVSWYTALEQGRDIHPSDHVLRNLAKALQLSQAETKHLFFLAQRPASHEFAPGPHSIHSALIRLLADLNPSPAFIADRRWDWLAWNPAADVLYGFDPAQRSRPRNALVHLFEGKPPHVDPEWERSARSMVARFRALNTTSVGEPWFEEFACQMMDASEDFRRIWRLHDVEDPIEVAHVVHHPTAGLIKAELVVLETSTIQNAWVIVFLLDRGDAERLGLPTS